MLCPGQAAGGSAFRLENRASSEFQLCRTCWIPAFAGMTNYK